MSRRFFAWGAVLALIADQVTKVLVLRSVGPGETVQVIPHFLRLVQAGNPHGVFGLSFGPRFIHYILPAVGAVAVAWLGLRARARWSATAYGLLLGGAVGNLADRVRLGHVVDFIDMGWRGWHWFTYNIADAALVAGIVILLAREFIWRRGPERDTPDIPAQPN